MWQTLKKRIDWILLAGLLPIFAAGLVTMKSFTGETDFFARQILWITVSLGLMIGISFFDVRFLQPERSVASEVSSRYWSR